MKPSRRRDSLEKAARKEAEKLWICSGQVHDHFIEIAIGSLLRFARRHGAKVRRETLYGSAFKCCYCNREVRLINALTPRGEKPQ